MIDLHTLKTLPIYYESVSGSLPFIVNYHSFQLCVSTIIWFATPYSLTLFAAVNNGDVVDALLDRRV